MISDFAKEQAGKGIIPILPKILFSAHEARRVQFTNDDARGLGSQVSPLNPEPLGLPAPLSGRLSRNNCV